MDLFEFIFDVATASLPAVASEESEQPINAEQGGHLPMVVGCVVA